MKFVFFISRSFYFGRDRCLYDLAVFSAGTAHKTVKATEVQCRTETNVPEYSEDGGKPQCRLRKTDAGHEGTQKSRARRAGIEPTTSGALASVTAH